MLHGSLLMLVLHPTLYFCGSKLNHTHPLQATYEVSHICLSPYWIAVVWHCRPSLARSKGKAVLVLSSQTHAAPINWSQWYKNQKWELTSVGRLMLAPDATSAVSISSPSGSSIALITSGPQVYMSNKSSIIMTKILSQGCTIVLWYYITESQFEEWKNDITYRFFYSPLGHLQYYLWIHRLAQQCLHVLETPGMRIHPN